MRGRVHITVASASKQGPACAAPSFPKFTSGLSAVRGSPRVGHALICGIQLKQGSCSVPCGSLPDAPSGHSFFWGSALGARHQAVQGSNFFGPCLLHVLCRLCVATMERASFLDFRHCFRSVPAAADFGAGHSLSQGVCEMAHSQVCRPGRVVATLELGIQSAYPLQVSDTLRAG